jgi:hypothetical protein
MEELAEQFKKALARIEISGQMIAVPGEMRREHAPVYDEVAVTKNGANSVATQLETEAFGQESGTGGD